MVFVAFLKADSLSLSSERWNVCSNSQGGFFLCRVERQRIFCFVSQGDVRKSTEIVSSVGDKVAETAFARTLRQGLRICIRDSRDWALFVAVSDGLGISARWRYVVRCRFLERPWDVVGVGKPQYDALPG